MFDTHCHLNFKAFDGRVDEVIDQANKVGVSQIVIPGTDVETSKKAVAIAEKHDEIYAAVGIHPHHVFEIFQKDRSSATNFFHKTNKSEKNSFASDLKHIKDLLKNKKVVAIGEVGIDRHIYQKTKYPDYKIEEEFVELQKIILKEQIKLAIKYDKSLILHNREAREETLGVLEGVWDRKLEGRTVFHCCEPDKTLLRFAQDHKMFIGVDGDITYSNPPAGGKQQFIKTVPLKMLVLETDSPFLMPRLLSGGRSSTRYNEPKNIPLIAEFIAQLLHCSIDSLAKQTTENARRLFKI